MPAELGMLNEVVDPPIVYAMPVPFHWFYNETCHILAVYTGRIPDEGCFFVMCETAIFPQ